VAQDDDLKLPLTATAGACPNDPAEKPVEHDQHDAYFESLRRRSRARPSRSNPNFFTPYAVDA